MHSPSGVQHVDYADTQRVTSHCRTNALTAVPCVVFDVDLRRHPSLLMLAWAPSSVPKNLQTSPGSRLRARDRSMTLKMTVLMPLPLPSTFPITRGILYLVEGFWVVTAVNKHRKKKGRGRLEKQSAATNIYGNILSPTISCTRVVKNSDISSRRQFISRRR